MAALSYTRLGERKETVGPVCPESLLGTWLNTNNAKQGITKAILTEKDSQVVLHVVATNSPQLADWGEAADVFASDNGATEAMAFSTSYDFGSMETHLHGHVRQGVLILAKFNRCKHKSRRSNHFSKEAFYRGE